MSSSLPPEILDLITDHLRDKPTTLKACCLVSKSWIQRTRKHLFACVKFHPTDSPIELWKKTFPDPPNSPACHTRHLSIYDLSVVTAADADAGGWIRTFHNVEHLHLECLSMEHQASLVPFHGLPLTLKSLSLRAISSEVLDLICSFPLLEDLRLSSPRCRSGAWNTPPTSPKLTGSLDLRAIWGIRPVIHRLLDLPDGLHFARVMVMCRTEDAKLTTDLVSRCSDTLEYLEVSYYAPGAFPSTSTSSRYLTTTSKSRHVLDASARPLQGHKTQRIVVPVREIECPTDHDGTPNRSIQTPSADRYPPMFCPREAD
jgi:hypothetical protein